MNKVVDVVVDKANLSTTKKLAEIGARMKDAREASGLSRPSFATKFGGTVRTLENNEGGRNEPGAGMISAFVSLGINANWLLTGEGPMLLADLVAKPEPPRFNMRALAGILEGILQAGAPPDKAVPAAFEFYQISIDRGLITADGIGSGREKAA